MQVRVLSKSDIIANFSDRMLSFLLASLITGGLVWFVAFLAMRQISDSEATAWISGIAGLISGIFYFRWQINRITKILSKYRLSLESRAIRISGRDGWKEIDTEVKVENVEAVSLGQRYSATVKWTSALSRPQTRRIIREAYKHRLVFLLKSGQSIHLNSAGMAFDKRSLGEFLAALERKGVNVSYSALQNAAVDRPKRCRVLGPLRASRSGGN